MRVAIGENIYEMSREQANGVIKAAAKQVSLGIYAVEMKDYCELRNDLFENEDELKAAISEYVKNGLTVHFSLNRAGNEEI